MQHPRGVAKKCHERRAAARRRPSGPRRHNNEYTEHLKAASTTIMNKGHVTLLLPHGPGAPDVSRKTNSERKNTDSETLSKGRCVAANTTTKRGRRNMPVTNAMQPPQCVGRQPHRDKPRRRLAKCSNCTGRADASQSPNNASAPKDCQTHGTSE